MTEILFVHGALVRDGAWWWRRAGDLIEQRTGVVSRAIELPSCGEGALPGGAGLAEDAAALTAALDRVDDAVVVGHSYGGTVIAEGADHPAARRLVLISSYLPDAGQAQGELLAGEQDPVTVAPADDGTGHLTGLTPSTFAERFLQDVPDEHMRAAAWERVTSQGLAAFATPLTRAAWQERDSTYLVCTEDASTSVDLQRFHAARATRSFDLPTGHHPFLSRPDLVADRLVEVLAAERFC